MKNTTKFIFHAPGTFILKAEFIQSKAILSASLN